MKIRFIKTGGTQLVDKVEVYYHFQKDQFLRYFFDIGEELEWVDESQAADICVYGVQMDDESQLRDNEKNLFFSIENMRHWSSRGHYKFFNNFKWDESKKTNIYIQNDIDRIVEKETHTIYPTVYFRVDYFNRIKENYKLEVPWEMKKFCLFISQNFLNPNKERLVNELAKMGPVNHINDFGLQKESCYNSNGLLKVFSFYKFVICCENSKTKGYVTEKIFNVLLAGSIPIYDGAPDIERYINNKRFIKCDNNVLNNVKKVMNDEKGWREMVNRESTNVNLNMENFKEKFIINLKN